MEAASSFEPGPAIVQGEVVSQVGPMGFWSAGPWRRDRSDIPSVTELEKWIELGLMGDGLEKQIKAQRIGREQEENTHQVVIDEITYYRHPTAATADPDRMRIFDDEGEGVGLYDCQWEAREVKGCRGGAPFNPEAAAVGVYRQLGRPPPSWPPSTAVERGQGIFFSEAGEIKHQMKVAARQAGQGGAMGHVRAVPSPAPAPSPSFEAPPPYTDQHAKAPSG